MKKVTVNIIFPIVIFFMVVAIPFFLVSCIFYRIAGFFVRFILAMSKETFDFSEALRRMKEGKKVRRVIWEECGAYIHIVSETIVAVCDGKFFPCVFKDSEDILATDWEEVEG